MERSLGYFTDEELSCSCCGRNEFDPQFLILLNAIREACGPLPVSSGYRCPNHPIEAKKTNGPGEHTTGLAVDIAVSGYRAHRLIEVAVQFGIPRIGVNQKGSQRFIHLGINEDFPNPTIWSY